MIDGYNHRRLRRVLIIPAAGVGSRLKAAGAKALVAVNGRPMLDHLLERFGPFVEAVVVIVHPLFTEPIRDHLRTSASMPFDIAVQEQPTGMLDAILLAAPSIEPDRFDRVWIVWCDQVGVLSETLVRLARAEAAESPSLIFPLVHRPEPYIHFPRGTDGRIIGVLQRREHDVMPDEGDSDMGVFSLSFRAFAERLPEFAASVTAGSGTGERNFLPFVPWLAARETVSTVPATDPREAIGINTPEDLETVEAWLQRGHTSS
jgi:bifunctional UDP-N-acetylglucosamine pyrophosphorylase / glucosamine-1-phosphate N-acetyltransferase